MCFSPLLVKASVEHDMLSQIFFTQLTPMECNEYLFYLRQKYSIDNLPPSIFNDVLQRLIPKNEMRMYLLETNKTDVY